MKRQNLWQGKRISKGIALFIMISLVLVQAGCLKIERTGGGNGQDGNTRKSNGQENKVQENDNAGESGARGTYAVKARAQDDYYAYVNGEELAKAKLAYGKAYGGPIQEMDEAITEEIHETVIAVGRSTDEYPEGSAQALVRAVWKQYLDYLEEKEAGAKKNGNAVAKANAGNGEAARKGNNPVEKALAEIRGAASIEDLLGVAGEL